MPEEEDESRPSKSAVKREMTARQRLGEALVALSPKELERMPVEDPGLISAINQARSIRSNSARRRQMQYIGKLMRGIDPDPIARALEALHQQKQEGVGRFHELEDLRDTVLRDGLDAMHELLARYPDIDRQHIRQLIMQHQRESAAGKPPAAARKIFRYLRELEEA